MPNENNNQNDKSRQKNDQNQQIKPEKQGDKREPMSNPNAPRKDEGRQNVGNTNEDLDDDDMERPGTKPDKQ